MSGLHLPSSGHGACGACDCDAAGSAIQPQTRAQPGVGAPALASERRRPLSRVATARVDIADLSGRLRAREPRSLRAQERRRLQPLRKPPSQPPTQRSGMRSCSDAGSSLRNRRSTASFLGSRFETGVRSEPPLPALLPCCPCCRRLPHPTVWIADIAGVAQSTQAPSSRAQTGVPEPRRELCSVQDRQRDGDHHEVGVTGCVARAPSRCVGPQPARQGG